MDVLFTTLTAIALLAFVALMLLALAAVSGRPLARRRTADGAAPLRVAHRAGGRPKRG
jgi:hypothetical protein